MKDNNNIIINLANLGGDLKVQVEHPDEIISVLEVFYTNKLSEYLNKKQYTQIEKLEGITELLGILRENYNLT